MMSIHIRKKWGLTDPMFIKSKLSKICCYLFLVALLVCFGCADRKKTSEAVGGKKGATASQIATHFEKYTRLKATDPVRARGELYVAAHLLHDGHPKSDLWAELVYEMDTKGEIAVEQLLRYEKLQLEIAIDKGASKETIDKHQEIVAAIEARITRLIAEGKDPERVKIAGYTFDFSPDP